MSVRSGSLESLRELNRLRVVDALRRHGMLSRADIARITGLSRSTISTLVADLHARGFVIEREEDQAARRPALGRPPVLLRLDPSAGIAAGVDFDHACVRVAVSDLSRTVVAEGYEDLDVDHDAARALALAEDLLNHALDEAGVEPERLLGVGVAIAAPVDPVHGRIHPSSILADWTDVDVASALGDRLGVPVHMDNDANLGALAEVTLGAGRNARAALYVQLSSGIGAGLIVDGRPYRGASGMAGEIGHVSVDPGGLACRCGGRGCLETVASSTAVRDAAAAAAGRDLDVAEVVALARNGDAACLEVLAGAGREVGRVLGEVCNVLNPEMVVVGGDLTAAGDLVLCPLREALEATALPAATADLEVVRGALGERANVLGALALAIAQSEQAVAARIAAADDGSSAI